MFFFSLTLIISWIKIFCFRWCKSDNYIHFFFSYNHSVNINAMLRNHIKVLEFMNSFEGDEPIIYNGKLKKILIQWLMTQT